jgi:hypothetical protein
VPARAQPSVVKDVDWSERSREGLCCQGACDKDLGMSGFHSAYHHPRSLPEMGRLFVLVRKADTRVGCAESILSDPRERPDVLLQDRQAT